MRRFRYKIEYYLNGKKHIIDDIIEGLDEHHAMREVQKIGYSKVSVFEAQIYAELMEWEGAGFLKFD